MASYRYRAQIPAKSLNARINKLPADILIFAKPLPGDLAIAENAKASGSKIVVDVCDDHLNDMLYRNMIELADLVTVPTRSMGDLIPCATHIVPDTYERDELPPHCNGMSLLWFGHKINAESLRSMDHGYAVTVVSNIPGAIPWSPETLTRELALADMVLLPQTASYKSPNRALEAIRAGCFVVAEPHPSLDGFPIWIGNIKEGIEWAASHANEANQMITEAQTFIRQKYSPAIQASAWRTALQALG